MNIINVIETKNGKEITVSSRDIAIWAGKRHFHVLRDIDQLFEYFAEKEREIISIGESIRGFSSGTGKSSDKPRYEHYYISAQNKRVREFRLNRYYTELLLMSYKTTTRDLVLTKVYALEAECAELRDRLHPKIATTAPIPMQVPTTLKELAAQYAACGSLLVQTVAERDDLKEEIIGMAEEMEHTKLEHVIKVTKLKGEVLINGKKVKVYDKMLDLTGTYSMSEAAKYMNIKKARPEHHIPGISTRWALLDDMGCQVGVETSKLTTVMNDKKTESTKSTDTIKLGIDAHSKWYYVARQLDGATPIGVNLGA